ncbi:MAG: hypothetical protein FD123_3793 [Bacteroidetes bacterium]|nr:MAG: hypothetical protein FD123_3793 [Bacteroidota bacterium]
MDEHTHETEGPSLKERIVAVLRAKNFSYSELVNYLGTSEEALDQALADSTIEIRTLEQISKELRIPLYSFFRDPSLLGGDESDEQAYYNVNIWAPSEIQLLTENDRLRKEIEQLKLELAKKELLIQSIEEQFKNRK